MAEAPPRPWDPRAVRIAEALIAVALRTELGQAYWNGYLIGAGLPRGGGALTVTAATYSPEAGPTVSRESGPPSPRDQGPDRNGNGRGGDEAPMNRTDSPPADAAAPATGKANGPKGLPGPIPADPADPADLGSDTWASVGAAGTPREALAALSPPAGVISTDTL